MTDLEKMDKAQLDSYAAKRGITLNRRMSKKNMLADLEKQMAADAAADGVTDGPEPVEEYKLTDTVAVAEDGRDPAYANPPSAPAEALIEEEIALQDAAVNNDLPEPEHPPVNQKQTGISDDRLHEIACDWGHAHTVGMEAIRAERIDNDLKVSLQTRHGVTTGRVTPKSWSEAGVKAAFEDMRAVLGTN